MKAKKVFFTTTLFSLCLFALIFVGAVLADGPLDAPDNIACLPFAQAGVTGYNGNAVSGPYTASFTQTVVTWRDLAEGEDNYRIDRQTVGSGTWDEIATVPADTTIYTDMGIQESDDFRYRAVPLSGGNDNTAVPLCRRPKVLVSGNIRVYYRPYSGGDCPNVAPKAGSSESVGTCAPQADAQLLADTLDEARLQLVELGFVDGVSSPPLLVDMMPCDGGGCAYGNNTGSYIGLRPSRMVIPWDPATFEGDGQFRTALHEMFHRVQGGLDDPNDRWIIEGQARSAEDKVCVEFPAQVPCYRTNDHKPNSAYVNEIAEYMADPNRPITDISYNAVLFWTYITEQYGQTTTEPQRGIDWLAKFWSVVKSQDSSDAVATVNATFDALCSDDEICWNVTFADVFKDFAVANYVKDLDNLPAKYDYIDDDQPISNPTVYANPVRTTVNLTENSQYVLSSQDSDLARWGARYFRFVPDALVDYVSLDGGTFAKNSVYWTVLAIKDDEIVEEINQTSAEFTVEITNNDLDEVVLVVAGLETHANLTLAVNATEPTLNIVAPTGSVPAKAGDLSSPRKIVVQVEVLDPQGEPLAGLNVDDFSFTVETKVVDPNQVISAAYIQGQYWFVLRPPTFDVAIFPHHLTVDYQGDLTDTENFAVAYENVPLEFDNMLVIDRSGSMADHDKMAGAQDAALLYLDSWESNDQIGVVSYATEETVDLTLRTFDAAARQSAQNAINALTPEGATAIGLGLQAGMDEFIARGRQPTTVPWSLVLLTDGLETLSGYSVDDFVADYKTRVDEKKKVPELHVIALGADADQQAMQALASATGGSYQYAAVPAGRAISADLHHDLAEMYRVIAETTSLEQQVYAESSSIAVSNSNQQIHPVQVDGATTKATFAVSVVPSLYEDQVVVELVRPNGTPYGAPTYSEDRHYIWHVDAPEAGEWEVRIHVIWPGRAADGVDYLVEASLSSDLTMNVFLGLAPEDRIAGNPMPVYATLADTQPLTGASVVARFTTPSDSTYALTLFDDGQHGDGEANDGFYGNTTYATNSVGSYQLEVEAAGTSPLNGAYVRIGHADFYMAQAPDDDSDGLPDTWQDQFPCLDPDDDGTHDDDHDGLTTREEFNLGTNPCNPDSDGGGEQDGSEVGRGNDPREPDDDEVRPSRIIAWPGAARAFIAFPVRDGDTTIDIFRASGSDQPFTHLTTLSRFDEQYHVDLTATNDQEWCYYLVTTGRSGATAISDIRCTTPKADPIAPHAWVEIDETSNRANLQYTVQIGGNDVAEDVEFHDHEGIDFTHGAVSSGVVDMRIANSADFSTAVWQPYQSEITWTLEPVNNIATVYVQLRDAAGNVSATESASIIVEVPTAVSVDAATAAPHTIYRPLILILFTMTLCVVVWQVQRQRQAI